MDSPDFTTLVAENKTYERLGKKTFYVFLLAHVRLFSIFFIAFIAELVLRDSVPANYLRFYDYAVLATFIAMLLVLGAAVLTAYLKYKNYAFYLGDDVFKIRRGILSQEEIGIPYRRIQEVRVERTLNNRALGVSTVIITLLGQVQGNPMSSENRIILPAIDEDVALKIQDALLRRAQVEQIRMSQI